MLRRTSASNRPFGAAFIQNLIQNPNYMKIRILLPAVLLTLTYAPVQADSFTIGVFAAQNRGEYVSQVYNGGETSALRHLVFGNYTGPDTLVYLYNTSQSGSTITMDRNYKFYGISMGYEKPRHSLSLRIRSTFFETDSGKITDIDYKCICDRGRVRMSLPFFKWEPVRIKDTAYRINYPYNDVSGYSRGVSKLRENGIELDFLYFPRSRYENDSNYGFYLKYGLHYLHTGYRDIKSAGIGDGSNVIFTASLFNNPSSDTSYYYFNTLRFKTVLWEIPLGFGYRFGEKDWSFDIAFSLLLGKEIYVDNHVLRGLTVTEKQFGVGYSAEFMLKRRIRSGFWAGLRFYRKTMFFETEYLESRTRASFSLTGVPGSDDDIINSMIISKPGSDRGVKEYRVELHVEKKFKN